MPKLTLDYMLNRGYAYTTIITSKYHGQTLLFPARFAPAHRAIFRTEII